MLDETEVRWIREKGAFGLEKGTGKQGERYWVARFHRPPLQIRAGALISWSIRPYILERSVATEFYSAQILFRQSYVAYLLASIM